jgi:hypothetical protein
VEYLERIRSDSIRAAHQLGVEVSDTLPLLDAELEMRSAAEAVSRILVMNAVAAVAYGFDKTKAIGWLNQEQLTGSLSPQEKCFLFKGAGRPDRYQVHVEGMWALCWAMGFVNEMNFAKSATVVSRGYCPISNTPRAAPSFARMSNLVP